MDSESAVEHFEDFFSKAKYFHLISATADQYPTERSICIDFKEIEDCNEAMADYLLKQSRQAMIYATSAINTLIPPERREEGVELNLRFKNIPHRYRISELRTSEVGHMVSFEGLVRRVTEVRPRITMGIYECQRCSQIIKEPQDTWHPKEPLECYKEQNGCGRTAGSTKFKLLLDVSPCVDSQKIEVQEPTDALIPGAQAQRISCFAEADITGIINPGDRVIINGIHSTRIMSFPMKSTMLDTYNAVNSIETQERIYEEIVITPEDEREIQALSKNERCCMQIVNSLIPTVHGMPVEKEALALQLFGGVTKNMPDGSRLRGDIHILLVGDPGTAKSTLLRAVSKIAPRGIFTSGKSTSGPGLIASVVKDDFGEGRWTVEAGAMALADRGHLCADELDKMDKEDRLNMHEAMAQQEVYLSKAGIHTMIHTRCPVLAAANPKDGRFDTTEYLAKQINMPTTLLSRFDLIFSIFDTPDNERDTQVADHILRGEKVAQVRAYASVVGGDEHGEDDIEDLLDAFVPEIEPAFLRKYIAYAKRNIMPVMGDDAMERIRGYYVDMRDSSKAEDTIAITPRQLQAVIRLSESSARMHLSNTVDVDRDVERAIRIIDYFLKRMACEEGTFDIDIIESGVSHSQRERMKTVRVILKDLGEGGEPIDHEELVAECEAAGIIPSQCEKIITKFMVEDGTIYETFVGSKKYRLVR